MGVVERRTRRVEGVELTVWKLTRLKMSRVILLLELQEKNGIRNISIAWQHKILENTVPYLNLGLEVN